MKEIKDNSEEYKVIRNDRELREKIKMVMEDPDVELEFFKGLNREIPPASEFMKGTPGRPPLRWRTKRMIKTAVFAVFCFGLGVLFNYTAIEVTGDRTHVDVRDLESYVGQDGPVILAAEGYELTERAAEINDEANLLVVLREYPEFPLPGFVPGTYRFNSLIIEGLKTEDWQLQYTYINNNEDLLYITIANNYSISDEFIKTEGLSAFVPHDDYVISYHEDPLEINSMMVKRWTAGGKITISAVLDEEQMNQIMENIIFNITQ